MIEIWAAEDVVDPQIASLNNKLVSTLLGLIYQDNASIRKPLDNILILLGSQFC